MTLQYKKIIVGLLIVSSALKAGSSSYSDASPSLNDPSASLKEQSIRFCLGAACGTFIVAATAATLTMSGDKRDLVKAGLTSYAGLGVHATLATLATGIINRSRNKNPSVKLSSASNSWSNYFATLAGYSVITLPVLACLTTI